MTEEEEYTHTLLALLELVRNGTVCLLDPGSTKFSRRLPAGVRGRGREGDHGRGRDRPRWHPSRSRATRRRRRSRAPPPSSTGGTGALDGRLRAWAMPFSPETCSVDLPAGLKRVVDHRGTGLTLHHVAGRRRERTIRGRWREKSHRVSEGAGRARSHVLLAHALGLDYAEVDCVARTGAAVTMCPSPPPKAARGPRPSGACPSCCAGVRVALGCDSPNNSTISTRCAR